MDSVQEVCPCARDSCQPHSLAVVLFAQVLFERSTMALIKREAIQENFKLSFIILSYFIILTFPYLYILYKKDR